MDEAVLRAIVKWPNVPAAYGWLSLDRRGDWFVKGERITSPAMIGFIGRNYAHDEDGRWFFQNGPQRVFVALGYAPFVLRTDAAGAAAALRAHNGLPATEVRGAWLDENGALLIACLGCVGLIHDRDLAGVLSWLSDDSGAALADASLEAWLSGAPLRVRMRVGGATVPVERIHSTSVPARFGFDPAPRPRPGEPEC